MLEILLPHVELMSIRFCLAGCPLDSAINKLMNKNMNIHKQQSMINIIVMNKPILKAIHLSKLF